MLRRAVYRFAVLLTLLTPWRAFGQTISTIAGNAINDGRQALQTPLVRPHGMAVDANGNLLIADRGNFVIRRVSASTGLSSVLAGGGNVLDDAIPIPARTAGLDFPLFIAVDASGNIYFSDFNNYRVRKITPDGLLTTVAGSGIYGYSGDGGRATLAEISSPSGVALDRSGNLYFSDTYNSVVRRVNLNTGIIQTVAGNGTEGYSGDNGLAIQARLNSPWGLAVDAAGNLYIADYGEDVVRKVSTSGIITTEVPLSAGLAGPSALAFDSAGRLHVADYYNDRVVRVGPGGTLTTVAGGGEFSGFPQENVVATATYLFSPNGIAFDAAGNLYISEDGWNLVRRVDTAGRIRTFAGTLDVLDGGPALNAPFSYPIGIAVGATGAIYLADVGHHRIRRIDTNGTIQTVAGNGLPEVSNDGAVAASSSINYPTSVSLDGSGNLYFTEAFSMVRKLTLATGLLSTVAGIAYDTGFTGENGPAVNAKLNNPYAAVADTAGNIYISDRDNHCIRRVDTRGVIRAVAGICSPGTEGGYSGDGGPALQAKLSYPAGLALDLNGNLLIADSNNSAVRRLNVATGIIERVAGKPQSWGYSGDGGPPLQAELGSPVGLAVDRFGTIFITDEANHAVRYIRGNLILTLAGVGAPGFYGDGGKAEFAWLNTPEGVAVDGSGNVFIVDSNNNRIRRIGLASAASPVLTVDPTSLTIRVPQGAAAPPAQGLNIRNAGSGFMTWSAAAATSSGGPWIHLSDNAGTAPGTLHVSVSAHDLIAGTYQGAILIRSQQATNGSVTVSVTLTVESSLPPTLSLSTRFASFEAVQGGAAPPSQILSVTNSGSGNLNWNTQTLTSRGGDWLAVSPSSGAAQAGGEGSNAFVSVNPASLSAGLYLGIITVTNLSTNTTLPVAVSLSVGLPASRILLSSTSFVFTVVQGSTAVPSQTFRVLNSGEGIMEWQVQSILAQGDWLRVSPTSGSSDAANRRASPTVTLNVDPSTLSPGVYGGLLLVQAPGARNNPQFATVIMRVLPPGSPPTPQVQPSGLTFTGTTGSAPLVQEVTVQTTGGGNLTFTVGTRTQDGAAWLTASPSSGALLSASDRTRVRVQFAPGTLPAGVYQGAVTFSFSNGSVQEVAVAGILRGPAAITAAAGEKAQEPCPSRQVLVSTRLPNNFSLPTGWPVPMAVTITNDCGQAVVNSTVAASFSNGDPTIILLNLGDGQYSRTWVPTRTPPGGASNVQVSLRALNPALPEMSIQLTGSLSADSTNPVINDNGIVNAASFTTFRPVAPGAIVTLFGSNLASSGPCFGGDCAAAVPLPTTLGGVSVKVGGLDAPLFYAGPSQINAQVPFELSNVTSADVVVTARGIVSTPRTIQLDATQPGIFVASGTQGAVLNQNFSANSASNPAARGSVIQIFATGLGPTDPSVPAGTAAPSSPPFATVVNPVTVTLGGVNAPVQFQALAPGFVGLYQINVQVPSGVSPGSAVPLKIIQNGSESNEVTVAIN